MLGQGQLRPNPAGPMRTRYTPCRTPAILFGHDPPPKIRVGGGGGNRTRVQRFEKRATARDFRCQGSDLRRIRCPFESPGVPYSPLESPPVLETFWRRDPQPVDKLSA